jgi:translocation and assembly module TamA
MKKILFALFIIFLTCSAALLAAENVKVEIKGLDSKALKNAQDRLALDLEAYGSVLSAVEINHFSKQAPAEIQEAIKPFGFFKSKVTSKITQTKKANWLAEFFVERGPALRVKQITLDVKGPGELNPELQKYLKHFPIKQDDILQIEVYNQVKEDLLQLLFNQGYIRANFEKNEIQINISKNSATIDLHLQTGERFYFGSFLFNHSHYSPAFLQKFVRQPADEPFSNEKLYKMQEEISASQYFKRVEMTPELDQPVDHQIPVNVKVTDRSSQKYRVALGYGTFTGVRTTLGFDIGRITDTGQYLNAELKLSSVLSGLAMKYFIPGKNPLTDTYSIGANLQRFLPKNGSSTSREVVGSSIKGWGDWQTTTSLNYLNESFKVVDEPSHVSQAIYPSFNLSRTKANNLIFPTKGSKVSLQLQAADKRLFSRNSFFQAELKGKYIFSPIKSSRVILRGDLGYTVVHDLNYLPLTLRYFAGGLGSVRGYPYSSLGPGRYMKVGSVEYQHRIYGNWGGAVFYDAGTASNNFNSAVNRGIGVGVIYKSILGPVQLYISRAESTKGKPLRIDINLGSDF